MYILYCLLTNLSGERRTEVLPYVNAISSFAWLVDFVGRKNIYLTNNWVAK